MAKDYGNRRSSRQKGGAPQQFLVIIVTFLLGYLTASVFDIQTVSQWMNTQVLAHQEVKQAPSKAESAQAQTPPKPKFEFYTLLANEKGETHPNASATANRTVTSTTAVSTHTSTTSAGTASAVAAAQNAAKLQAVNAKQPPPVKVAEGKPLAPAPKGSFLVQVAAFKVRKDAEHMRGTLTLKGFDVKVVSVSNAKGNWFRVVVGPYSNRDLAQKAQVTLAKTERLHGMVTGVGG